MWHLMWLIPIVLVIILVMMTRKRGGNATHTTSSTSTPSPKQDGNGHNNASEETQGGGGFFATIWKVIGTLIALGVLALLCLGLRGCYRWINPLPSTTERVQQNAMGEGLILEGTCITPCTFNLKPYPMKIRTNGDDLWIKFTGVEHWFAHPGKEVEYVPWPPGVREGETKIISRNPSDNTEGKEDSKNPHVKVWIYRVIK